MDEPSPRESEDGEEVKATVMERVRGRTQKQTAKATNMQASQLTKTEKSAAHGPEFEKSAAHGAEFEIIEYKKS